MQTASIPQLLRTCGRSSKILSLGTRSETFGAKLARPVCNAIDQRWVLLKAIALRLDQLDRKITICADAMSVRDGQWVYPAGLVLVRQKPGSIVWPSPFQKRRRIVLGSSMMAINSRVKCEGEVVHFVAQQLLDLTGEILGLADRDEEFKLPAGRGDEFAHGG